jgi:hypothetical protein
MIFKQYDNGSCDIEFSWKERIMILKKGKIHLSDENLKHFGNNLIKVVMEWQLKFNEKTQNIQTYSNKVDSK